MGTVKLISVLAACALVLAAGCFETRLASVSEDKLGAELREATRVPAESVNGFVHQLQKIQETVESAPAKFGKEARQTISDAITQLNGIPEGVFDMAAQYEVVTKLEWLGLRTKLVRSKGPYSPKVHSVNARNYNLNSPLHTLDFTGINLQRKPIDSIAASDTSPSKARNELANSLEASLRGYEENYIAKEQRQRYGPVAEGTSSPPANSAVELWLVRSDTGAKRRVNESSWLSFASSTTATVHLGPERRADLAKAKVSALLLAQRGHPDRVISEIPIEPFSPPLDERTMVGKHLSFTAPERLRRGDAELGGNANLVMSVDLRVSKDGSAIEGRLNVEVQEKNSEGNWIHNKSHFVPSEDQRKNGWERLESVDPATERIEAVVEAGRRSWTSNKASVFDRKVWKGDPLKSTSGDGNIVTSYEYKGDSAGKDLGVAGAKANLANIKYFVRKTSP
jgi:hypothetical protein